MLVLSFLSVAHEKFESLSPGRPAQLLVTMMTCSCCLSQNQASCQRSISRKAAAAGARDRATWKAGRFSSEWPLLLSMEALCLSGWVTARQGFLLTVESFSTRQGQGWGWVSEEEGAPGSGQLPSDNRDCCWTWTTQYLMIFFLAPHSRDFFY